ncbi:MAG TPA: basic secretory protein-like protein [Pseudonocardiaceae bacterium]
MPGLGRCREWLVAAVAVALLAGIATVSLPPAEPLLPPVGRATAPTGVTTTPPVEITGRSAGEWNRERAVAIRELLDRRARAVVDRDEAAFMSTVDPAADPAFRQAQRQLFANLADVPLGAWTYLLHPDDEVPAVLPPGTAPADALWAPRVELRYAYTADPVPTVRPMGYLFARRGERWYLTSDTALGSQRRRTWRGPWDFGPVHTVTTQYGLVLGHPGNRAVVSRVARELDDAVQHVTAVWGPDWSRRVVVLLPETSAELQATVGVEFAVDGIAAVAVADRVDRDHGVVEGARVVLNPQAADRLSTTALRVVLRHEITHVAARASTVDGTPMWLLEGFADYVGYHDSALPPERVAPELARMVRAGQLPDSLPEDSAFHSSGKRLDLAYQMSWSLAVYLEQVIGQPRLVEAFRQIAGIGAVSGEELDTRLRTLFGMDRDELLHGWRQFLHTMFR